jgi:RHS repeat-associated protein
MVDSVGNVTTSTDPLGHSTTYVYDVLNRKTQTVDARGGIVTTLYDAVGNNTTVVDQVGNTTTMAFDVLNRMTQQTAPLNHSSTMAFDALGRQTSATDRNGQVINTTYDNDNRVLTQIWKNSGDTTVNTLTYSYDSAGNELTAANGSGPYTMSYDTLNRATLTKEPFGVTLTSAYDALSRRTLLKDSLGGTITSTYDNVGNLTDRQFSASGMTTLDVSLGYTALNQLAAITRTANPPSPFSTYTSLTYDAAGRMTFLKHYDNAVPPPHGGHTFETITYTYDAASRLTTEVRNGTTTTYQYDATNELTNDTANSYSYDLAGNRTMNGYTTGSANELTNDGMWTYSYDNNGNMTKKSKGASAETWYFGYDNLNRMTSAKQELTDGGTLKMQATYVYDVFGDRIEKDVWMSSTGTVVTRFAYDGQNAFADLNSSNQLQMRRLYGDAVDQLFARENSSGTLAWYLTDRLGSVRDVLNASSTVLDHIDYDGFGNATETNASNGDRYKWTGREFDSETGLQYNRARFYNPTAGRWAVQDPIGFKGNDFNLYRYASNNPLEATDPTGMLPPPNEPGYQATFWAPLEFGILTKGRVLNYDKDFFLADGAVAWSRTKLGAEGATLDNTFRVGAGVRDRTPSDMSSLIGGFTLYAIAGTIAKYEVHGHLEITVETDPQGTPDNSHPRPTTDTGGEAIAAGTFYDGSSNILLHCHSDLTNPGHPSQKEADADFDEILQGKGWGLSMVVASFSPLIWLSAPPRVLIPADVSGHISATATLIPGTEGKFTGPRLALE